jgi:MFS family permease
LRFLPPDTSPDAGVLIATRGVRGFVDGLSSVVLAAYLPLLGFSGFSVGIVVTGMLLGSAAMTIGVGLSANAIARRRLLLLGGGLMVCTGLGFTASTLLPVLAVIGAIGTMNPTAGDVSVFLPIEQSLLPTTTSAAQRTALFARYAFVGSLAGAFGSLAAHLPQTLADATSLSLRSSLRLTFLVYSAGGLVAIGLYLRLTPAMEPPAHERPTPLGPSRSIVLRLAGVFSLDAFGGGFVVQSILALWLFRRFDLSLGAAGTLLFVTGTLSAASGFAAAWLAERIGLVRTMVFTHLPANALLVSAALVPSLPWALGCLIARSLLSQMDVPARTSYVMAVVSPAERAAAASTTNVPRSLAGALPPLAAGWLLDHTTFGWPLVIGGVCKAVYDLLLLFMFRNVRPPEEATSTKPGVA